MDFKKYIQQKKRDVHKDILLDICMNVKNCADCYNEQTHQCECDCFNRIKIFKSTEKQFYIEPYSSKTNLLLRDIAENHGYNSGIIEDSGEMWLKFWKIEGEGKYESNNKEHYT